MDTMLKGTDSIPEFMMNMGQQICDGCFELQRQMIERASKIGQQTKAYSFEDIDQEVFRSFREIYEKEFKKFFQIPQLGLTRFYQERSNRLMDKLNMFNTHLSEFVYLFYVPIEKATAVMQEKISLMAEKGELHDDIKVYYNNWVKILEGHYMTLLQSPEYTQALDNTIGSLVEYREAKDDLLSDVLQFFPIPTNKEMDALYKEFHVLKRKIRELSQKLEDIETGKSKA
jgi:class III poly(R)-hydroxyalkanoic acid synthase PhaE subunit